MGNNGFDAHPEQVELARVFSSVRLLGPPLNDNLVRLIAHLFEPQQAAVAKYLPYYRIKDSDWIARRANRSVHELRPLLKEMSDKRVIFRAGGRFSLLPLIPGMFEHMLVSGVDTPWHRRYAELLDDVFRAGYVGQYMQRNVAALRNIPVQQTIETLNHVATEDLISEMIRLHADLAIANVCQCRQSMHFIGKSCKVGSPSDGCLLFGKFARGSIHSGDARRVSRDEMRAIVDDRWKKNMVLLTANVQPESPNAICTCCKCCCHMLESINDYGAMPVMAVPHFVARVDEAACTSCMKCAKACNTRAHELVRKKHVFHVDRCIGCGLCVTACKEAVVQMVANPAYKKPARDFSALGLRMLPDLTVAGLRVRLSRLRG